jgi:hypothetical protein
MAEPTYVVNLLNILGENVSLTPTNLAPSEMAIVEFDRYYVPPDISGNDLILLKNTMREVFDNKLKQIIDTESGEELPDKESKVYPPCGAAEKAMVLKSLLYRKDILEQQLYNIGIKTPDELRNTLNDMNETSINAPLQGRNSLLARTYLTQYLRLKNFINKYDAQQFCIHLEDIAYGDLQLDLTDKKVQELLRQFVFFVLQGHHPLEDFKKTDPTAPRFLQRLTQKPLGEPRFKEFLDTYRANKLPIPPSIAKVLEASNMDPAAMKDAIDTQIKEEQAKLLDTIRAAIPPTDAFWKRVSEKENLKSILDALLLYPKDLLNEIKRLEASVRACEDKQKTLEQAKRLLENQKDAMTRLIASLQADLAKATGKDEQIRLLGEQRDAALADFNARLGEITARNAQLGQQLAASQQALARTIDSKRVLDAELATLRARNLELERIAAEANTNLEGLRRTHEAQLQAERQRAEEAATGRATAEQALQASRQETSDRVAEVASIRAELGASNEAIRARDADIAALRQQLQQRELQENEIRGQITAKTNELRDTNAQLGEVRTALEAAQEEARALRQQSLDSKSAEEEKASQIQELERTILQLTSERDNLAIQVKACEKEKEGLKSSASGTKAEVAAVAARLQTAEEQKAAAQSENERLKARLAQLEAQVLDAAENVAQQKGIVKQRDATIEGQSAALAAKTNELGEEKKRADAAEGKVAEIAASKDALEASFSKQLDATEKTLRAQFADEMGRAKGEFERILGDAKGESDAQTATIREAHSALRDVVLAIAAQEEPSTLAPKLEALPEREALQTILQRLSASTTAATVASVAPPALMQCYYVFLVSFLWQTNFPTLLTNATTHPGYTREKICYNFFNSVFNTGVDPGDPTGKAKLGKGLEGLYVKLKTNPKITEITLMRDFFLILQSLARAMESSDTKPIVFSKAAEEQTRLTDYLKALITQLSTLSRVYAGKMTMPASASGSFSERAQAALAELNEEDETGGTPSLLADFTKYYMSAHQYGLPTEIFAKRIIIDDEGVKLGVTGDLNYAVLFYCFLLLMRDYLILIENTGAQCKLPNFLKM